MRFERIAFWPQIELFDFNGFDGDDNGLGNGNNVGVSKR